MNQYHIRLLAVISVVMTGTSAFAQNSSLLRRQANQAASQVAMVPRPATQGVPQATVRPAGQTVMSNQVMPRGNGMVQQQGYPGYDADSQPLQLEQTSYLYQAPPPKRSFAINDIVTIRVDEITRMMAEGSAENRKITQFNAVLTDWLKLDNFRLRPDPQNFGDPTVGADSSNIYRAEGTVETRETLTFNIAAKIVDIRPNGQLVLEATKSIRINDNLWEKSLTGICRAVDIAPDNVVLSRDLLEMSVNNQDRGQMRDGYKRGWLTRWFDRLQPF